MVEYYKYVDESDIERYLIIYNGYGITIKQFNLEQNCHLNLLSLNVNYSVIYFNNLKLTINSCLNGCTISSLYEKDIIKICDYLNSICTYNKLNNI